MTHQTRSLRLILGTIVVGLMTLFGALRPAFAGIVALPYSENFATPAANETAFQGDYPEFTVDNADTPTTVDNSGVLHLNAINVQPFKPAIAWVTPTLNLVDPDDLEIINVDVAGNNPLHPGSFNVGIDLGDASSNTSYDRLVFHPGYINGAFRISVGAGDGANTDMRYEPANNDPQHVHLVIDPSGLVDITITDSADPSHVFTASFTNPLVYGASVGLYRSLDQPADGDAQFSNFSIVQVPEPSSLALLAIGGMMVFRRRWA